MISLKYGHGGCKKQQAVIKAFRVSCFPTFRGEFATDADLNQICVSLQFQCVWLVHDMFSLLLAIVEWTCGQI